MSEEMRNRDRIARIEQMEQLYDTVLYAKNTHPESFMEDRLIRDYLQKLSEYYTDGQWLKDYESDERGELPADLKRGVLSQDALYDLFSEIEYKQNRHD